MAEEEKTLPEKIRAMKDEIDGLKNVIVKFKEANTILKGKLEVYAKQIEEAEKETDEW